MGFLNGIEILNMYILKAINLPLCFFKKEVILTYIEKKCSNLCQLLL